MEQSPATRRLTRGESDDSPVEFVVVESDVSMSDAGTPEKKPKKKRSGLSFKKLRTNAQKLIPKRGRGKDTSAKSSETSSLGGDSGVVSGGTDDLLPATPSPPPPPASPTATETSADTGSVLKSTESLPAIKEDPVREAAQLAGARSDEDILLEDKQRQKKTRKPSRAASFMKKLAGRSKTSKVAPNPATTTGSSTAGGGASEGDELSSGTLETPLSIKRQTPEGAMFVSDTELYEEDGTSVDPPSPVLVRQLDAEPTALRAKRTEMKITLTRNSPKPSTMETSLDDDEETDVKRTRNGGGDSNGKASSGF